MRWKYTLDISDLQQAVRGIELHPDGTMMWLMDTGRNDILQYHLAVPWELASARFDQALSLDGISRNSRGINWRPDGQVFFVTSTGDQKIYEFKVQKNKVP